MKERNVKKLEEMNLLDDFLFGSVVTCPEIGERFVRILLRTIFGREFRHLSVTAQKVFYGADTDKHGARLDLYLETEIEEASEGNAVVYDIEPDKKDSCQEKKMLPRRVRFYHGKIAARSLESGTDYDTLKNVIVIMILPFDPFGLKRMVYTVKNRCVEEPEMEYEDGASTLFLYTKGTVGVPNEKVEQLLHYMEDTTYGNAVNEDLREIHRMVETVKRDQKVVGMHIQMVDDLIKQTEQITRQAEQITELEDKTARQAEEIIELEDKTARQTEEITKQAEVIRRLRDELEQRKAGEEEAQKR